MNIRLIPRLDIKGPNLVKGIHFEGLRVLGKPEFFSQYYYENGADELIYIDAVASLYGRNSLLEIIKKTARRIFIPLTVGGGLRSVNDIQTVLRAGADKIALNTAALARPELIQEAARAFGSSTVVVSIEAIRETNGTYTAYANYGRERTGVDVLAWARQAVELGAGELLITSINRDGTGQGFDLALTRQIATAVPVPVIAGGGAGKLSDVLSVIREGQAEAVALGSMLHYHAIRQSRPAEAEYVQEGNIEFLKQGRRPLNIQDASLTEIKALLSQHGIACREDFAFPLVPGAGGGHG